MLFGIGRDKDGELVAYDLPAYTPINWDVSSFEQSLIEKIADRAKPLYEEQGIEDTYMTIVMDLTACHANGTPLKLDELLRADKGTFGHDVFGIRRYIDRSTGKLTQCFLPRTAMPQGGADE